MTTKSSGPTRLEWASEPRTAFLFFQGVEPRKVLWDWGVRQEPPSVQEEGPEEQEDVSDLSDHFPARKRWWQALSKLLSSFKFVGAKLKHLELALE